MELDLLVSAIQQKPIIIEPPSPYYLHFPGASTLLGMRKMYEYQGVILMYNPLS